MRVAGIGQCCLDHLTVIDIYPGVDTKNEVFKWIEQAGGPVATALAALSRLGISCKFYGITGDDYAGEKIKHSLIYEGINVSRLIKRENSVSQLAFIVIEKGTAKRTIFWKRPSGVPLRKEEIGNNFLKGINFILLDGLMKDVSLYAAKKAKSLNIPVMLDAGKVRPGMLKIARLSDYVVASEEFVKELGWDINAKVLHKEKEKLGVKVITVTLGERGSITVAEDQMFQIPAFKVKAVDTTGAGDVFHGGYIYGLLQGWNLKDTVIFASALAAIKCKKIGARAGIPRLNEVMDFLKRKDIQFPKIPENFTNCK
jgi:sulfofructose kinase